MKVVKAFMNRAKLRRDWVVQDDRPLLQTPLVDEDGSITREAFRRYELDIVMERRKALEWLLNDNGDWDDVDLST